MNTGCSSADAGPHQFVLITLGYADIVLGSMPGDLVSDSAQLAVPALGFHLHIAHCMLYVYYVGFQRWILFEMHGDGGGMDDNAMSSGGFPHV